MATESSRSPSNSLRYVVALCLLVFLGVAIEIVGISNTDKLLNPLRKLNPVLQTIGGAGIALTAFSPFLALFALTKVRAASHQADSKPAAALIWVMVILAVLLSFAESMWTCSGHPTWYQGYLG
jgi:hypothetical protein